MKSAKTLLAVFALLLMIPGLATAQGKTDPNIKKAMNAVFKGPESKGLKIFSHKFNVKKAKITRSGDDCTVEGRISHCLRFRPDDQVDYVIRVEKGIVKKVDIKIKRGGFTSMLGKALKVVEKFIKIPVNADKVEELGHKLGGLVRTNKWEDAAEYLVGNIALRAHCTR